MPRTAIKALVLADFVMECTFSESQLEKRVPEAEERIEDPGSWKLFIDGSATIEGSGAGLILVNPKGFNIQHAITITFKAMNNQAEYEALISGLRLAKSLGVKKLHVHTDSQIVVKQTVDEYTQRILN